MISDAKTMPADALQSWVESIGYCTLTEVFVQQLASRSPHARELMLRWMESPAEYVAQAGWDLLALTAMNNKGESDAFFVPYLDRIEREVQSERNRVRHAMNGSRRDRMQDADCRGVYRESAGAQAAEEDYWRGVATNL